MQEFEVNDKERKCKGYTAVITGKNIENVLTNMKDIIEDYYVSDSEIVECFDDLIDECDYMSEVKVTCYIFKNKIAAIILENEYEDEIIIEFNGGATRTENICVTEDGEKIFEVKGSTKDHIETRKMYQYGYKFGELTYDTKKGDLTIKDDYDEIKLNIESSAKEIKINLADSYIDGDNVEGSITISSSPKFDKLTGKTFDIGNADEEEFEDLFYEIEDELEELLYLFY